MKYEIRAGGRIGVVKSINNCRLFVWGIPPDTSEENVKSVSIVFTADDII
jgi:hypothetical protein